MATLKTIQVPGYRKEYDLFWGLFFRGALTVAEWSVTVSEMPRVRVQDELCLSGQLEAGKGVVGVKAAVEVTVKDARIEQLTKTGTVDLFETMLGTFTLSFGNGSLRMLITRTAHGIRVEWPEATPRVDVPWWPIDPVISYVEAFPDYRVHVKTTRGNTVAVEFT